MQRVPLFIGRWKPGFAIFFIRTGDGPFFGDVEGVQTSKSRESPPSRGRSPASRGTGAEGNAERAGRDLSARHLIPVLEIGPHEDFSPSDRGQHRALIAVPTAVSAQQKTLYVAGYGGSFGTDHPRGGVPGVREGAQRQDRVRRRQLDRHAGQAAGAEGQPGDRRRHHRRRPDVPGDPARLLRADRGPDKSELYPAALFKDDKAVAVGQTGTGFMINTKMFKEKGWAHADLVERSQGSEVQEAARHPADQQHLRPLHADDVSPA